MLEKFYLSDNPNNQPGAHSVKYLSSVDELLPLKSALIYCDSPALTKMIRKYDDQGKLHLGCRGANVPLMYQAKVLRFGEGNYLICSNGWNDEKFNTFLTFQPKPALKLPETHYLNINSISDDEAVSLFNSQMDSIKDAPALGIDFETSGFPEEAAFFPLGLSICDTENSYYYDFDCYLENKSTKPKFYAALKDFVRDHAYKLYAFNVSFEIRCFYFMYRQFFKLQDTRAWCIVDGMKSNLKYGAQYYLEVASWDDSVDEEMRALAESFAIPLSEFKYEYGLGPNSQYSCVRDLVNYNKDNPDFLSRYEKYHGSTWACANQKTVGKYCCYDSVMDIHIYNVIKNYYHVDHYYSDECYQVYLFNQYLATIIDLSGIFIDPRLLEQQRDTFKRLKFNTELYLNKEMVKYKISYLKKRNGEDIQIKLNEKLAYIVDELGSYMFVNADRIKLAKEFAKLVREKPEVFPKLITKHIDELEPMVESWKDDEAFAKLSRQRKVFKQIGDWLYEEWDLNNVFRDFNEQYLAKTDCNRKALKELTYSEEELKNVLALGEKKWKEIIKDAPSQYYAKQYIYDLNELHDAKDFENSLELRKYQAMYERMVPCLKGKTIYDEIDESLSWMFLFEFNAPLIKDLTGTLLQDYCQDSYATFAGFQELIKKMGKPELNTRKMYDKYVTQIKASHPCLKTMPEYYDYYYEKVPVMETRTYTDKRTGEIRTYSAPTGEFNDYEQMWIVKNPPAMAKIFPPFSIPAEQRTDPWTEQKEEDMYSLDYESDIPIFECTKFMGLYKLNRVVMKMMSTSEAAIDVDSRNIILMDASRGLKIDSALDPKKLIKYYIKIHQNMAKSGRWQSNVHSVFAPSEDTRVILQNKMGDHFLLTRRDDQDCDTTDVYRIDGYNFRPSDEVKLSDGRMVVVKDLTEADSFDTDWLANMIQLDKQRTGDVLWDFADICYSQNPIGVA